MPWSVGHALLTLWATLISSSIVVILWSVLFMGTTCSLFSYKLIHEYFINGYFIIWKKLRKVGDEILHVNFSLKFCRAMRLYELLSTFMVPITLCLVNIFTQICFHLYYFFLILRGSGFVMSNMFGKFFCMWFANYRFVIMCCNCWFPVNRLIMKYIALKLSKIYICVLSNVKFHFDFPNQVYCLKFLL